MDSKPRLVIVGAGFGGINLAKYIDKKKWDVTLIDRNNYHSFPPLFYQVASSGLEPGSITFALRREMRARKVKGCHYRMGNVTSIDVVNKTVTTQYETIPYDKLVIAVGTTNNYFGIPGLKERVFTLKSAGESLRTRNQIIDRMERASVCEDPDTRRAMLTFAVIGGGPTGVEVAGALGEMKRYAVPREYPELSQDEITVKLIEGTDKLLRTMSEKSSADALRQLQHLMVDVELNKTMSSYADGVITFGDGTTLATDTVIWTAGVTGESIEVVGGQFEYIRGNRIAVDEFNRVKGYDDIYAIGDVSGHCDARFPAGAPQLAQPAIQQGRNLAKNLNRDSFVTPFSYKDKGSMATVGRNRAVVDIGKIHFSGYPAWMTWMAVHLLTLMGMRNRLVVLVNWIWNYWSYSAALRIMLSPSKYPLKSELHGSDPLDKPTPCADPKPSDNKK